MTSQIPEFVRDLLAAPPRAGEGVHGWLFRVARQLHAHLPSVEIVTLLENRVQNCGRAVPRHEIVNAVQNSIPCAWTPKAPDGITPPAKPRWPAVDEKARQELVADGGLADLWEASPVRFDDNAQHSEEIIDQLFPGNPLLCCGMAKDVFNTQSREDWRGKLAGLQFIVPSPASKIEGLTKKGEPSRHCLDNTGPRRFLVVEFDTGAADEHAAILLHLATRAPRAPLALAVHSGSKSLHGWFYCAGQTEEKLRRFMERAACLGACPSTWTRSQFVRMPDGTRDNGKRQAVYFFNPKVCQ